MEAEAEYDIEDIMGSITRRKKVLYLVKWLGFPRKKDWTYEPYENFSEAARSKLEEFHSKHPTAARDYRLRPGAPAAAATHTVRLRPGESTAAAPQSVRLRPPRRLRPGERAAAAPKSVGRQTSMIAAADAQTMRLRPGEYAAATPKLVGLRTSMIAAADAQSVWPRQEERAAAAPNPMWLRPSMIAAADARPVRLRLGDRAAAHTYPTRTWTGDHAPAGAGRDGANTSARARDPQLRLAGPQPPV